MKSSYPDEFCRIPRQSDFHIFRGNGCRVTLRDEIVYENIESREMTWVKFMGYNLNLNRDKINGFGPELDSNEGGHVARRGPHIQLKLSWDKRGIRAKRAHFSYWFTRERERERERGEPSFLPRSMEFRGSVFVGPRTKVHRINERYV